MPGPRSDRSAAPSRPDLPILECASQRDWERWLEDNHAVSRSVWLRFAKRGAAVATVTQDNLKDYASLPSGMIVSPTYTADWVEKNLLNKK